MKQLSEDRIEVMQAAKEDLMNHVKGLVDKHGITAVELLAMTAFVTGAALASQSEKELSVEQALMLIQNNIEAGNRVAAMALMASRSPRH